MKCSECENWIVERKTVYGDGSEIVNFRAPSGNGSCKKLNMDTMPDFGCTSFVAGNDHVEITHKPDVPWHYWVMIPCPTCFGNAAEHGAVKCRCAGTGNVRKYDDGFVGDEQTRKHPKDSVKVESHEFGTTVISVSKEGAI